jgi:hypothetical protein
VSIRRGQPATLSVEAAPDHASFQWYEGLVGDDSKPAGTGKTFITPAVEKTTKYWVKVMSPCGTASSQQATVTVRPGRRHAVNH